MSEKPGLFSRKFWGGFFLAFCLAEGFALVDELLFGRNYLDPLSAVVKDQTWSNPETFGTAILLVLAWLIFHWFVWPLYEHRKGKG